MVLITGAGLFLPSRIELSTVGSQGYRILIDYDADIISERSLKYQRLPARYVLSVSLVQYWEFDEFKYR